MRGEAETIKSQGGIRRYTTRTTNGICTRVTDSRKDSGILKGKRRKIESRKGGER